MAIKVVEHAIEAGTFGELRPKLRAQLVATYKTEAEADEILDLAFHAADEALATLLRIVDGASVEAMKLTISSLAAMVLDYQLDSFRAAIADIAQRLEIDGNEFSCAIGEAD